MPNLVSNTFRPVFGDTFIPRGFVRLLDNEGNLITNTFTDASKSERLPEYIPLDATGAASIFIETLTGTVEFYNENRVRLGSETFTLDSGGEGFLVNGALTNIFDLDVDNIAEVIFNKQDFSSLGLTDSKTKSLLLAIALGQIAGDYSSLQVLFSNLSLNNLPNNLKVIGNDNELYELRTRSSWVGDATPLNTSPTRTGSQYNVAGEELTYGIWRRIGGDLHIQIPYKLGATVSSQFLSATQIGEQFGGTWLEMSGKKIDIASYQAFFDAFVDPNLDDRSEYINQTVRSNRYAASQGLTSGLFVDGSGANEFENNRISASDGVENGTQFVLPYVIETFYDEVDDITDVERPITKYFIKVIEGQGDIVTDGRVVSLSGEIVRDLLAALTGDERLDVNAIKNAVTDTQLMNLQNIVNSAVNDIAENTNKNREQDQRLDSVESTVRAIDTSALANRAEGEIKVFTSASPTITQDQFDNENAVDTRVPYRVLLDNPQRYLVIGYKGVDVNEIYLSYVTSADEIDAGDIGNSFEFFSRASFGAFTYNVIDIQSEIASIPSGDQLGVYVGIQGVVNPDSIPTPQGGGGGSGVPGAQGPKGDKGDPGDNGWTPTVRGEIYNEKRLIRITGYTGGTGTEPTATGYLAVGGGLTNDRDQAIDFRGAQGIQGEQGTQGVQGQQGIQGERGLTGDAGAAGQGVPAGGNTGQILAKIDGTNYNTRWINAPTGGGGGGGTPGTDGLNGWTPRIRSEVSGERRLLRVTGYFGGTGTAPTETGYLSTTGDLTSDPAQAMDFRGAQGATGAQGLQGEQGERGQQGETGARGDQGLQGEQGIQGERGLQGEQGERGQDGAAGDPGQDGAAGQGVPTGGDKDQILAKQSATDYDTHWIDAPSGNGGGGGTPSTGTTTIHHSPKVYEVDNTQAAISVATTTSGTGYTYTSPTLVESTNTGETFEGITMVKDADAAAWTTVTLTESNFTANDYFQLIFNIPVAVTSSTSGGGQRCGVGLEIQIRNSGDTAWEDFTNSNHYIRHTNSPNRFNWIQIEETTYPLVLAKAKRFRFRLRLWTQTAAGETFRIGYTHEGSATAVDWGRFTVFRLGSTVGAAADDWNPTRTTTNPPRSNIASLAAGWYDLTNWMDFSYSGNWEFFVLPENYTDYKELCVVIQNTSKILPLTIPTSCLVPGSTNDTFWGETGHGLVMYIASTIDANNKIVGYVKVPTAFTAVVNQFTANGITSGGTSQSILEVRLSN